MCNRHRTSQENVASWYEGQFPLYFCLQSHSRPLDRGALVRANDPASKHTCMSLGMRAISFPFLLRKREDNVVVSLRIKKAIFAKFASPFSLI